MKIVKDIRNNWEKMDGDSPLEKKINALLCCGFISDEAPSDECVSYAKKFSSLTELGESDFNFIKNTIKEYFFTASDLKGNVYHLKDHNNSIDRYAKLVIDLIKESHEKKD